MMNCRHCIRRTNNQTFIKAFSFCRFYYSRGYRQVKSFSLEDHICRLKYTFMKYLEGLKPLKITANHTLVSGTILKHREKTQKASTLLTYGRKDNYYTNWVQEKGGPLQKGKNYSKRYRSINHYS